MGVYQYTAIDERGGESHGTLEGDSEKAVRANLREKGLIPVEVATLTESTQRVKGAHAAKALFPVVRIGSLSAIDLALITRELAALIGAGMPVDEALQACAEQVEKARVRNILLGVRTRVVEGYSLAKSLAEAGNIFPEAYCAAVAAGEESGHLDTILEHLADYTEYQQAIRSKVRHAMIYPGIMTLVSVTVIVFLMILVVPSMVEVFNDNGTVLPTPTVVLLAMSSGLAHYGFYLLAVLGLAVVGFRYALRRPAFKFRFHALLLKLPLIGNTTRAVNTARFARTLGMLSSSGVSVLEAMRISLALVSSGPIRESIESALSYVREGTSIHRALKSTGYFAPVTLHFIANGEKSGRLEEMLGRAADYQDSRVTQLIDTTLSLFEPLLILVMGLVVLFIVIAILLPMFQMTQMVG